MITTCLCDTIKSTDRTMKNIFTMKYAFMHSGSNNLLYPRLRYRMHGEHRKTFVVVFHSLYDEKISHLFDDDID